MNKTLLKKLSTQLKLKPKELKKIIDDVDYSMRESTAKLKEMCKRYKKDSKNFEKYLKESK